MRSELVDIVKRIRNLQLLSDQYLDKIPRDISSVVWDNEYSDLTLRQVTILIDTLFGDMAEDVHWFLNEFTPSTSGPHCVLSDGTEFTFNTDQDYYDYLLSLPESVSIPEVTRVEVIDHNGRSYTNMAADKVQLSFQDEGKTLKIFTGGSGSNGRV